MSHFDDYEKLNELRCIMRALRIRADDIETFARQVLEAPCYDEPYKLEWYSIDWERLKDAEERLRCIAEQVDEAIKRRE